MGKITVKHFVNKDLKPQIENSRKKFPVYVQVIVLTKNLKFKSNNTLFQFLEESDLANDMVQSILREEKETIKRVVKEMIAKGEDISSKNLKLYTKSLRDSIDENFSKLLISEYRKTKNFIPGIFLSLSYSELNEVIYFYNDDYPFSKFSSKVGTCLDAISAIYQQLLEDKYYVFDIFGGIRNADLLKLIGFSTGFSENETNEYLRELQELATM